MSLYRKKPVVVEAVQLVYTNKLDVLDWIESGGGHATVALVGMLINTLEGRMQADYGDWIIRGVKGEFYPCKPDIFEATYEPAETPERKG